MSQQPPIRIDANAPEIPDDGTLDSTLALLGQGYRFIAHRCEQLGTDVFRTRLMLRHAICVRGADAAAMFYQPGRFTRRGAMPPTTVSLLQDFGSVQQLDGRAHVHRKALFMQLLDAPATARLVTIMREEWQGAVERWSGVPCIQLQEQASQLLCRAICRWAGVPLPEDEVERRTREFTTMIEEAGAVGPGLVSAWLRRRRNERWISGLLQKLRDENADPAGSPAAAIATFRDIDGRQLDLAQATVELINLLRPTVAVARWITFAALALHEYPDYRERLQAGEPGLLLHFVQEVRRYYPFFPLIAGRVRMPFEWRGHAFEAGQWVLLDLYGSNRDPRLWQEPERFRPERFADWDGGAYDFVAQGAGDTATTHRCPGENPTIALLMVAVAELAAGITYEVPPQSLHYPLHQMPALPASGFVMCGVRRADRVSPAAEH